MAKQISLPAQTRTAGPKGASRQLRRNGRIPATLYGAAKDPVSLSLDPRLVNGILRSDSGHNTIFQLAIEGGEATAAMLVDWQREPLRGQLLHVDLKRIAMDKLIRVRIPVQAQGEASGVKLQGGILELVTREIEIECLPDAIPEHIVVNVTGLSIGQNLRVGDVKLEGAGRVITDPSRVIAHVVAIKEVVEATPAEGAAAEVAAEPEVIKKGKAETEEGEEKEKGGKEKDKKEKK